MAVSVVTSIHPGEPYGSPPGDEWVLFRGSRTITTYRWLGSLRVQVASSRSVPGGSPSATADTIRKSPGTVVRADSVGRSRALTTTSYVVP
jgi:hypothetical protein